MWAINLYKRSLFALTTVGLIVSYGCAHFVNEEPAPVVSLTDFKVVTQGIHIVQANETLYSIAWRYGRDYKDLAAANHIASPYRIYPNQKLNLKIPTPIEKSTVKVTPQQPKINPVSTHWHWPAQGKILKQFSAKGGFKGIDIGGVFYSDVKATKAGKVVYSGSGLRGYGNLVIIKHDETYLSAYGHNHLLLVKEGDNVRDNQVIAKMGRTEAKEIKVHFEIRKNGQPVNPILLLPKQTA